MILRRRLAAATLALLAIGTVLLVADPRLDLEIPAEKLEAEIGRRLPRSETVALARIDILDAVLSLPGEERLEMDIETAFALPDMEGRATITASSGVRIDNGRVFLLDPRVEEIDYALATPDGAAAPAAPGLARLVLPSLTRGLAKRFAAAPVLDLRAGDWKARIAGAVIEEARFTKGGLEISARPARALSHLAAGAAVRIALATVFLACVIVLVWRRSRLAEEM